MTQERLFALFLSLAGPIMLALGAIFRDAGMLIMGPIAFITGAWVLRDGGRR